jgi:hypothetical protein
VEEVNLAEAGEAVEELKEPFSLKFNQKSPNPTIEVWMTKSNQKSPPTELTAAKSQWIEAQCKNNCKSAAAAGQSCGCVPGIQGGKFGVLSVADGKSCNLKTCSLPTQV